MSFTFKLEGHLTILETLIIPPDQFNVIRLNPQKRTTYKCCTKFVRFLDADWLRSQVMSMKRRAVIGQSSD